MKILHVPNAYFPVIGGAENNCRRFSEILASQGHEVFLADAPTVSSMANTLERLWAGRMTPEAMGKAAAKSIREHVPADPVRVFSEKMKSLAGA
jgi:hypothetical protein